MSSRRARIRLWLLDRLPTGLLARPAEWILALACFLSGVPALLGIVEADSLQALLSPVLYRAWGVSLIVGGAALLAGLSSIRPTGHDGQYVITRLPAYRFGLQLVGLTCIAYAAALVIEIGSDGFLASIPLYAFAGWAAIRLLTLGGR